MILAATIWFITIATTIVFAGRFWWFPESVAAHGEAVDRQFVITLAVTGVIFIVAQLSLGYLIVKYRDRPGAKARYSHGNDRLEVVWTVATTILFYVMVLPGQWTWADMHINQQQGTPLVIEVMGQQFAWNIRYPGPDGVFGPTRPELISDSAGNSMGVDFDDPAGRDDLVLPVMAIPINRLIELRLLSKDVIHSFFVRELRIKQDTVPGLAIPLRFTATKVGNFEISCAELCGLGHHRMRSFIEVLSEQDYQTWLREMAED